jgi:cation diffusion facilitator family transporter
MCRMGGDHDHDHGHGHGHSHSHAAAAVDRAMEDNAEGVRALKISLAGLAATAALQAVVAAVSGSVALLSDTLHNLADALTAVPLWLAFNLGRRPPSRRFTYGYGRAEDVAGLIVVTVIGASGAFAAWEAVQRLRHPTPVRQLGLVMVAAVIGIVGNELVALYRIRVGRRIGSAALVADGLHARADGLTSLAVLLGAIGVALGWERADAVAGLLIAAGIAVVLVQALVGVGARLLDAVDPELVDQAEAVVTGVAGVEGVDGLRIRWVGHRLHAEARITVDRDLDVAQAHDIAEQVHHALLHELDMLAGAVVHIDPCRHAGPDPHAETAHHFGDRRG